MEVVGRVAVVTGGSSGLGRRFCLDLARAGATVVAVARRKELLDEVAQQMRQSSPRSEARPCDLSNPDGFRELLASAEADHGRIDLLVNNAGVSERRGVEDQAVDDYRRLLETNFFAAVAGTLQVLPGMLARGFGVIVNMSSDAARVPAPPYGPYNASKAALSAFAESVAHEVGDRGVHVHVLYPGWVPTAMGLSALEEGLGKPPRIARKTEEQISALMMKKMGGPSIEINAIPLAPLAALARAFLPRFYRRQVKARG